MEQRIARLEEQVVTLHQLRTEDHEDLRYIRKVVTDIQTNIAGMRLCPSPGSCIPLQSMTADHERRLSMLEKDKSTAIGAMIAGKLIFGVVGTGFGALVTYLLTHHVKP